MSGVPVRCVVLLAALTVAGCGRPGKPPAIQWQRTVGLEPNYGSSVQQTSDGGYIVAGVSATDTFPAALLFPDILLVKLDSLGNTEWERSYGGPDLDRAYAVKQTPDGGYVFAGRMDDRLESSRAAVVKLDSLGNVQWADSGPALPSADDVALTADGGYIAVGGAMFDSAYLRKLDALGNLEWHVALPEAFFHEPWGGAPLRVHQTSDRGYITSYTSVHKVDSLGNLQWSRRHNRVEVLFCTRLAVDGGYIATGITRDPRWREFEYRLVLLKMDAEGREVWRRSYRDGSLTSGEFIQQLPDGGYFLVGNSDRGPWLARTDERGRALWAGNLPGLDSLSADMGASTRDGGYIVTLGSTLVKLAPEGK
ncbi:MAG: hypothetical protein R6X13_11415 [bacterium]